MASHYFPAGCFYDDYPFITDFDHYSPQRQAVYLMLLYSHPPLKKKLHTILFTKIWLSKYCHLANFDIHKSWKSAD